MALVGVELDSFFVLVGVELETFVSEPDALPTRLIFWILFLCSPCMWLNFRSTVYSLSEIFLFVVLRTILDLISKPIMIADGYL